MSEYDANYNWNKTWLNSAPSRRHSSPEKPAERIFQQKRHFNSQDTFTIYDHFSKPSAGVEDPYFLLGGGDEKFGSSVRYANRRFRAQSVPRTRKPTPPSRVERAKDDIAVNVTTHSTKHSKKIKKEHKMRPVDRWPEIRLDLPVDSLDRPNSATTPGLQPRASGKRPKTAPMKTEYQRSFSPPPAYIYKKPDRRKHTAAIIPSQPVQKATMQHNFKEPEAAKCTRLKFGQPYERYAHHKTPQYRPEMYTPTEKYKRQCFLSEYRANYKDFSDLIDKDELRDNHAIARGKLFALRNQESHFSKEYFAQLQGSVGAGLWDPLGSSRTQIVGLDKGKMERRMHNYYLPPAGRPSSPLEDKANDSVGHSILRTTRSNASALSRVYEPSLYAGGASSKSISRGAFSGSRSPPRNRSLGQLLSGQSLNDRRSPGIFAKVKSPCRQRSPGMFSNSKSPSRLRSSRLRSSPRYRSLSPLSKLETSSVSLQQSNRSPCPLTDNKTFLLSSTRRHEDLIQSHTSRSDLTGKFLSGSGLSCRSRPCADGENCPFNTAPVWEPSRMGDYQQSIVSPLALDRNMYHPERYSPCPPSIASSSHHHYTPAAMRSLAESTLNKALQRRNRFLVSSARPSRGVSSSRNSTSCLASRLR